VSYRKTKHSERIAGFDQAPDFIIPDEFNPAVIIEAKLTEDDGTARNLPNYGEVKFPSLAGEVISRRVDRELQLKSAISAILLVNGVMALT
jgi:hypothetical protein